MSVLKKTAVKKPGQKKGLVELLGLFIAEPARTWNIENRREHDCCRAIIRIELPRVRDCIDQKRERERSERERESSVAVLLQQCVMCVMWYTQVIH